MNSNSSSSLYDFCPISHFLFQERELGTLSPPYYTARNALVENTDEPMESAAEINNDDEPICVICFELLSVKVSR